MIYSRFDEKSGLYELFEDREGSAVNSDLPVPVLGPPTNGIGVPASEAGRPLPGGAKFVGRSWHARGMVVSGGPSSGVLSGLREAEQNVGFAAMVALGLFGTFLYLWYDPSERSR
jgi:hypothetical protein